MSDRRGAQFVPIGIPTICWKAKEKYRGVFEIQRSGDKTSSGEIGLDIRTYASPKVGQDQVSGGVSVLCWHAAPVAHVLWKPSQLGKKSNSVIRSRSVMVKNWCNVLSIEGVTVCGHHPECRVTFGRGGPHIVWWDPRTDHRTSLETISNVPWHIPAREAYWKVASPSE